MGSAVSEVSRNSVLYWTDRPAASPGGCGGHWPRDNKNRTTHKPRNTSSGRDTATCC